MRKRYYELVLGKYDANGVMQDSGYDLGVCCDHELTSDEALAIWNADIEFYGCDGIYEIRDMSQDLAYLYYDQKQIDETLASFV